jgi:hypothetical protein
MGIGAKGASNSPLQILARELDTPMWGKARKSDPEQMSSALPLKKRTSERTSQDARSMSEGDIRLLNCGQLHAVKKGSSIR